MTLPLIQSDLLKHLAHVQHGFMTRQGGVSEGIYQGLNCGFGSQDTSHSVSENRKRVAQQFSVSPANLLTPYQVHGNEISFVSNAFRDDSRPQVDGTITDKTEWVLSVLTADCAPVLFAANDVPLVAAVHAGWRGARYGVLESTLRIFSEKGVKPDDIVVAIGPCIAQESYEVDQGFKQTFLDETKDNEKFFVPSPHPVKSSHLHFDLPGYIHNKLHALGVEAVDTMAFNTYEKEDLFYSYRRATHQGEADYGRQISVIRLI